MQITSLYNGLAGVTSEAGALNSVSDNVGNVNTTGFKATRASFSDIMSSLVYTSNSAAQSQVGNGSTEVGRVVMSQGVITTDTGEPLDVAINGNGFFVVQDATSGQMYYTRDGAFHLDKDGYLVNEDGYQVLGATGAVAGGLSPIQINMGSSTYTTTSQVDLDLNLSADDTKYFTQATAVDPNDSSTYNYADSTTVYDANGDAHNLVTYYQRVSDYSGASPTGSATVWKASVFEATDSGIVANPTSPNNVYYMHFNTDGKLVGTSTDIAASGDSYTSSQSLTNATSNVSDSLGETLSYTGANGAESYQTTATVTFSGATLNTDTVTIGGTTFTMGANATATDAANDLASQINSNSALGYYAQANAGVVTLYAKDPAAAATLGSSGTNIAVNSDTTLTQLVDAINNGQASTGAINLAALAAGDTVTVAGTTFTQGVDFTDAATLATAINTAGLGVTASANGGNDVSLTANGVGLSGNAIALASTGGVVVSGATLQGGLDDSATSLVQATDSTANNTHQLSLARTDTGATATLTLGTTNTLGAGLGLDFDTYTQDTVAADASSATDTTGQVDLAFTLGGATQDIIYNYKPADQAATTQYAGDSEELYSYQNGASISGLESLYVNDAGNIIGHYGNGNEEVLDTFTLAKFKNPEGLARKGDNLWMATTEAGVPEYGQAGDETLGFGVTQGQALENSTVNLADEMVNMINYQRAYQANSKSITTSDEMLKTAINLRG